MSSPNGSVIEKLVDDWTLHCCGVACKDDTLRTFDDVKYIAGYKQFITWGERAGLSTDQIREVWETVRSNLIKIRFPSRTLP